MERKDWFGHVDAQSRSGLSVKSYCRNHGLAVANFYRYRRLAKESKSFVPVVVKTHKPVSELSLQLRVTAENELEFTGRTTDVGLLRSLFGLGR